MTIGAIIRNRRLKMNMSITDLSHKSDVSNLYISKLENGEIKDPHAYSLFYIMYMLDLYLDDILLKDELSSHLRSIFFSPFNLTYKAFSLSELIKISSTPVIDNPDIHHYGNIVNILKEYKSFKCMSSKDMSDLTGIPESIIINIDRGNIKYLFLDKFTVVEHNSVNNIP